MAEYTFADFRNESGLVFINISTEHWRTYIRSDKSEITIHKPVALNVSKAGGHRVFDAEGVSHYIPSGWVHLKWKAKESAAHFVK